MELLLAVTILPQQRWVKESDGLEQQMDYSSQLPFELDGRAMRMPRNFFLFLMFKSLFCKPTIHILVRH